MCVYIYIYLKNRVAVSGETSNMCKGLSKGEGRRSETKILKEITAPNLITVIKLQVQKSSYNPKHNKLKGNHTKHIIIKLLNTRNKAKISNMEKKAFYTEKQK